jgi:hypothetical protein
VGCFYLCIDSLSESNPHFSSLSTICPGGGLLLDVFVNILKGDSGKCVAKGEEFSQRKLLLGTIIQIQNFVYYF